MAKLRKVGRKNKEIHLFYGNDSKKNAVSVRRTVKIIKKMTFYYER